MRVGNSQRAYAPCHFQLSFLLGDNIGEKESLRSDIIDQSQPKVRRGSRGMIPICANFRMPVRHIHGIRVVIFTHHEHTNRR